jgi:hypothetical protein
MTNEKSEQQIESKDMEKQQNRELLRLETGYGQHASQNTIVFPEYHNATNPKIQNVLIQMKKDNKATTQSTSQEKHCRT